MNESSVKWLRSEGLIPDKAFYQLYDRRPEYEKLREQKEKILDTIIQKQEPENIVVVYKR